MKWLAKVAVVFSMVWASVSYAGPSSDYISRDNLYFTFHTGANLTNKKLDVKTSSDILFLTFTQNSRINVGRVRQLAVGSGVGYGFRRGGFFFGTEVGSEFLSSDAHHLSRRVAVLPELGNQTFNTSVSFISYRIPLLNADLLAGMFVDGFKKPLMLYLRAGTSLSYFKLRGFSYASDPQGEALEFPIFTSHKTANIGLRVGAGAKLYLSDALVLGADYTHSDYGSLHYKRGSVPFSQNTTIQNSPRVPVWVSSDYSSDMVRIQMDWFFLDTLNKHQSRMKGSLS